MTNKEMQRKANNIVRALSFELEQGNSCVDGALTEAQELLATLEAERTLEEGWAFLHERGDGLWEIAYLQGRSPSAHYITITERT